MGKTRLAEYYEQVFREKSGTGSKAPSSANSANTTQKGDDKDKMLVEVNCSCFTESDFVYVMFGYEKGAYTGASSGYAGLFELAKGKVLFLDEVADLSLANQARLLKALDRDENGEYSYTKKGRTEDRRLSTKFRLVCATRKNLKEEVRHGRFREDLYYRIAGHTITVRPLRKRHYEIRPLLKEFCKNRDGFAYENLHKDVIRVLEEYDWPGNIRQLKYAIDVIHIRFKIKGVITKSDVQQILEDSSLGHDLSPLRLPEGIGFHQHIENLKGQVLKQCIEDHPSDTVKNLAKRIRAGTTTVDKYKKK